MISIGKTNFREYDRNQNKNIKSWEKKKKVRNEKIIGLVQEGYHINNRGIRKRENLGISITAKTIQEYF